ncbi:RlpA-like double-psi beta-barrel-protein domain-containing protein-containing protein [Lactifluus subvellereus]|nr:RlpA-like double-psi beta-barrel-protein domain-containing protein-containing protein [Lactifluus subvellereus]
MPETTTLNSVCVGPSACSAIRTAQIYYWDLHRSRTGTWYSTGLGACGISNTDSDHIAAVSRILFDQYPGYAGGDPNSNPVCGAQIKANYQGNYVTVTVTDRCEACAETDLDFSPAAFSKLADPSVGRITGMTWSWA